MPLPAKRRTYRYLICVAAGLIGLAVIAIGVTIESLRKDAIADATAEAGNIATVLAEQTSRSVQAIDLVLIDLQERFDRMALNTNEEFRDRAGSGEIHNLLRERLARLPQADTVALVDADGWITNTSRTFPAPKTNVGDRDYHYHFKNEPNYGVFVSDLLLNRVSGHHTLFFSRRITGDGGQFLGVVLVGVKLSYFQHIYDSLVSLRKLSFLFLR
ncbi:MAG: hypothetical protein ABUL48_02135, partial [Pseudorhodoplanes sp.]